MHLHAVRFEDHMTRICDRHTRQPLGGDGGRPTLHKKLLLQHCPLLGSSTRKLCPLFGSSNTCPRNGRCNDRTPVQSLRLALPSGVPRLHRLGDRPIVCHHLGSRYPRLQRRTQCVRQIDRWRHLHTRLPSAPNDSARRPCHRESGSLCPCPLGVWGAAEPCG